jgi:hypothetical protein
MCSRHLFAIAALALAACGDGYAAAPLSSTSEKSIVLDRQVVIDDIGGNISSVTRTHSGFMVTGWFGTGWAVATDQKGAVLWKYIEPRDARFETQYQSKFNGAVQLSDGHILLCGENTANTSVGQLIVLDNRGSIIERRNVVPRDERHFIYSGIAHCFPWDDGIAVTGGATDGIQSASWLMRLDKNAAKQWEIFDLNVQNPIELADHSLVLSKRGDSSSVELARINTKGEVQARRTISGYGFLMLRSTEPTNQTGLISYGVGNKGTLYFLNEKLEDSEAPKSIASFDAKTGCGYVLADHSIALFGRTDYGAVAWIGESGQRNALMILDGESFIVQDALPTTQNQFVTVRIGISPNDLRGLILSWITFK